MGDEWYEVEVPIPPKGDWWRGDWRPLRVKFRWKWLARYYAAWGISSKWSRIVRVTPTGREVVDA